MLAILEDLLNVVAIVNYFCIFEASASEAIDLSRGDQKENEHSCLEQPVAPTSLEMGCCGCADEPSRKVEPTVSMLKVIQIFINVKFENNCVMYIQT